MERLNFFEKLLVLFNNILAHPLFICILLIPVLLIIFNKKITKKAVAFIYIGVLLLVLLIGNTTIFALFDNLVDGIFMTLYFPNFITLFLVEVLSAIICLITFIKKGITKTSKIINIAGFAIIQTLFSLILVVVQSNEIDIYKENALYASNDVLTLMQLLMGTFFLQIVTLLVVKAVDKVTDKLEGKEDVKSRVLNLPEGRITHAKLNNKIIIKTPEVKLDDPVPIKPLDKSLISSEKINPMTVNDEIIKDQNKPKKVVSSVPSAKNVIKIKPLIKEVEKPVIKEIVKEVEKPIIKEVIKEKVINPEVKLDEKVPIKPLDKSLIIDTQINPINVNEMTNKEEVLDTGPQTKNIKKTADNYSLKDLDKYDEVASPSLKNNISDPKLDKGESLRESISSNEEKELITNLKIIDFDKMVRCIKNLEIVYTL